MKSSSISKWISPLRLFQRLRHIHIENKALKILALGLALVLFAVSRQPISDVRLSGVPLEFRNLGPGVEISGDVEQTVSVRIRGPRDIVRSLTPNQLSVIANLSYKDPGERVIQLRPEDVDLYLFSDSIQVSQIEPASIRLKLEPTSSKSVNVEPQFMGQIAEGLEIYRVKVEPPSIVIEGPQSQVNKVNFVLTETINLNGRRSDFRLAVDVETPHNSLRVKSASPITLSVEVGERRITRHIRKVLIEGPNQQSGFHVLTKTVDLELYGPQSAIEALHPGDLHVKLNANGLPPTAETAEPQVLLPANADKHLEVKKIIPSEVRFKRQ